MGEGRSRAAVTAVAEVRSLHGRFDRKLRADELERLSTRKR